MDRSHLWKGSLKPLVWGFIWSIILVLAAYFITVEYAIPHWVFLIVIMLLAAAQATIQLVFFMHLGIEESPKWNLRMFLFMLLIIVVLVGGSLWIMHNLDYNVMLMK